MLLGLCGEAVNSHPLMLDCYVKVLAWDMGFLQPEELS